MKITFFGSGSGTEIDPMYRLMQATASSLPLDATIVTGGFTGSGMEAPAFGAGDRHSIGYTMLGLPGNEFLKETVDSATFLSPSAGNELQFTTRLAKLMESDAFVLGGDGGVGTLVEFAIWCNLNSKIWKKAKTPKRLAIMWPGNPEESSFHSILAVILPTLAVEVQNLIRWCKTAEEAVAWVAS